MRNIQLFLGGKKIAEGKVSSKSFEADCKSEGWSELMIERLGLKEIKDRKKLESLCLAYGVDINRVHAYG